MDEIDADVVISEARTKPQGLDLIRSGSCQDGRWSTWLTRLLPARSADRTTLAPIEVAERKGGEWKLVERMTPVSVAIPSFPFYFGYQDCTSVGIIRAYPVVSSVRVGPAVDPVAAVLQRRYGIVLPPEPARRR